MTHQTFLIGLVLVPALLLIVLVWWRFYGKGREAYRSDSGLCDFQIIQNRYYDVSDFIVPTPPAEPSQPGGTWNILEELLEGPDRLPDYREGRPDEEEDFTLFRWEGENPPGSHYQEEPEADPIPEAETGRDTPPTPLDPAQGSPDPTEEGDDAIAPSLFHNAVTAPANTENDSRNREAITAHRARRGAALRAKLTSQKEALGELFLGNPTGENPEG